MREFDLAVLPAMKLHLNLKYPSLEECYMLGYNAVAEKAEEENPFKSATLESEQWQEGWLDAMLGAQPIYKELQDQEFMKSQSVQDAIDAVCAKISEQHATPSKRVG